MGDEKRRDVFVAVYDGRGRRVPGVCSRYGHFYARFTDPLTGRQRYAVSRDGTLEGAKALVRDARAARSQVRAKAYHDALRRSRAGGGGFASIGACLGLYGAAARRRRLSSGGEPSLKTVNATVSLVRRVYAGRLGWGVNRLAEAQEVFLDGAEGVNVFSRAAYVKALRCVFAPWAVAFYRSQGLRLPDVLVFAPSVRVPRKVYSLPPKELRDATRRAGLSEMAALSDLGCGFVLGYFCAMSAADAARARWDWLDGRGCVAYERAKTGARARPPLSEDVRGWWERMRVASGREFVLPGASEGLRHDFVVREFSLWLRSLGWDVARFRKASHELRKLAASSWMSTVGPAWASAWTGDTIPVLMRFYADFVPERMPSAPEI